VAFFEEVQGLLSRCVSVYLDYPGTSLNGAQGVLWRVAMSLRARCVFFPTHPLVTVQLHSRVDLVAILHLEHVDAGRHVSVAGLQAVQIRVDG